MKAISILIGCALGLASAYAEDAPPKAERVKPVKTWNGVVKDESLRNEIPWGGDDPRAKDIKIKVNTVISREDDWKRLWKAWRGEEELPAVDFAENFIVVVTAGGGYRVEAVPELDKDGDLKVFAWGKADDSKGFGYQIAVLGRKGIKSLAGRRFECGRPYCMCAVSANNPPKVPTDVETEALAKKTTGNCWGDLAAFEVRKTDADHYQKVMEAAFAEAATSKRAVLVLAQIGALGDETLKSALSEPALVQRLRKEFVVVAVPTTARSKLPLGLKMILFDKDQQQVHKLDWGNDRRGPLPFKESQYDANVKSINTFLDECLEKAKEKP